MSALLSRLRRSRRSAALVAFLLIIALAMLSVVSPAKTAQANVTAPAAVATQTDVRPSNGDEAKFYHGIKASNRWVGSWKTSKGAAFCVEFNQLRAKYKIGDLRESENLDALTKDESLRAFWIAEKYRDASDTKAAAAAIAIWKMEGSGGFKNWWKDAKKSKAVKEHNLDDLSKKILDESKVASKNKLSVSSTAGLPGQPITITVQGRIDDQPAAGKTVSLKLTNTTAASAAVKLNSAGVGTFTTAVKSTGRVEGTASLSVPTKTGVVSKDPAARQQVIFKRKYDNTKATFGFEKTLDVTIASKCDTNCMGVGIVTVTRAVPCGAAPVSTVVYDNGVSVRSFVTAPCQTTSSQPVNVLDTHVVSTNKCYTTAAGQCFTPRQPDKTTYTVVCPPWITAHGTFTNVTEATWSCQDCSSTTTTSAAVITLTAPRTTRAYIAHVKLDTRVVDVKLPAGTTVSVNAGTTSLDKVTITFTAYTDSTFKKVIDTYELGKNKQPAS